VVTITAHDNSFRPESVTVPPGTTVRWTNAGTHKLTVTSDQNLWDSGDLEPGQSYEATFRRAGTYSYRCRHHPRDEMRGTIVVSNGEAATIARPGE
jgi:plastocyanin